MLTTTKTTLITPAHDLQAMGPGIYRMSNEDYHRSNGISRSNLEQLLRSPQHYQAAQAAHEEPTDAMIVGTAFHVKVLEPDTFEQQVAVAPKIDRRTNAGKEAWGRFQNDNVGKCIITVDQYDQISPMADAVHAHPIARVLLSGGESELSYYAIDPTTGVLCKCRPDYYNPGAGWGLVDLKSCLDARPEPFARAAFLHGYHIQSAYYSAVTQSARKAAGDDRPIENFFFVCVEKAPPYAVAVYLADDAMKLAGYNAMMEALSLYAECQRTQQWPGYPVRVNPLALPNWAMKGLFDE
jgi:hypothetical protein